MANNRSIALPYAKAVFGLAREDGSLDAWGGFFEGVEKAFSDLLALSSTLLGKRHLLSLVTEWVDEGVFSKKQGFFLQLLLFSGRFSVFPAIRSAFMMLYWEERSMMPVVLRSAFALSDDQCTKVASFLEETFSSPIALSFDVDADLIAGCVIYACGDSYDASVSGRLETLAIQLGL